MKKEGSSSEDNDSGTEPSASQGNSPAVTERNEKRLKKRASPTNMQRHGGENKMAPMIQKALKSVSYNNYLCKVY